MTNFKIVDSFLNRKPFSSSGHMSTNGKEIKSHDVVVARWDGSSSIVMPNASDSSNKRVTRCRKLVRWMAENKNVKVMQLN